MELREQTLYDDAISAGNMASGDSTKKKIQSSEEGTCCQLTVDEMGLQKLKLILLAILCVILAAFLIAFKVQYFLKVKTCEGTTQELESLLLHGNATAMIRTLEANLTDTIRELESMKVLHGNATAMIRTLETNRIDTIRELESMKMLHGNATAMIRTLETNLTETIMTLHEQMKRNNNHTQENTNLHQELNVTNPRKCAPSWKYFGGKCYFFSADQMNWTDSRDDCVTRGGHLVIVDNEAELKFMLKYEDRAFVGLNDIAQEGRFLWVDGTPMTDLQGTGLWGPGEPNNDSFFTKEEENCVELYTQKLNDAKCDQSKNRVCESISCGV